MSNYVGYQRSKWERARAQTLSHYGLEQLGAWEQVMPSEDTSPEMPATAPSGRVTAHSASLENVREMLLEAGVGQSIATMAGQYMFFLPRTSDPYAQGVIAIVQGLQRLLNKRGASLAVDGGLGPKTVKALRRYAGPLWVDKTWAQLYGDVLLGKPWRGFERLGRRQRAKLGELESETALGTSFVGDLFSSPLPLIAAAAGAWWYFSKKGRR